MGRSSTDIITLLVILMVLAPQAARAIPSYAQQMDVPCQACHVGAFGPQLKALGRDFKLGGYTQMGNSEQTPSPSLGLQSSFTHTATDQSPSPAPNAAFGPAGPNDNFALDQVELFWGGRIAPSLGAFLQGSYSGVGGNIHWDDSEIRYARSGSLWGTDFRAGLTMNNHPTIQDLWNSTPGFGFPYVASSLTPGTLATTQIDNALAQRVLGLGAYSMWNDWLFTEFDLYWPLNRTALDLVGIPAADDGTVYHGWSPYWRIALQHSFGDHYVEVGAYGMQIMSRPGGIGTPLADDKFTDIAYDANYQWSGSEDHFLSAHATLITETANLGASSLLSGTNPRDRQLTFRTDLSYSYRDTLTPTIQYFRKQGSNDPNYWGTDNGSPNSAGIIADLAFVPFGKATSASLLYNIRLDVQYIAYTRFNGSSFRASDNNAWYVNLWLIGVTW